MIIVNTWGKQLGVFFIALLYTSANYFLSHYNTKPERPKHISIKTWWELSQCSELADKGCNDTRLILFFSISALLVAGVSRRNWLTASCMFGCMRRSFFTRCKMGDIFWKRRLYKIECQKATWRAFACASWSPHVVSFLIAWKICIL